MCELNNRSRSLVTQQKLFTSAKMRCNKTNNNRYGQGNICICLALGNSIFPSGLPPLGKYRVTSGKIYSNVSWPPVVICILLLDVYDVRIHGLMTSVGQPNVNVDNWNVKLVVLRLMTSLSRLGVRN